MKAYKGFNQDMTCKGFQYEEGKEYEHDGYVEICKSGFHACEYPLDVFNYYAPNGSVYHEVDVDGDISKTSGGETKVSARKIKIGASISIAGLVKAAIEYTMEHINKSKRSDKWQGASSATGDYGASSATGYKGASSATGYKGASSATGYKGASSANHPESVAVAWGYKSRAKGVKGAYLVFADWEGNEKRYQEPEFWTLKGAKMVQVDGKIIKENTWYRIEGGEVIEDMREREVSE